MGLKEIYEDWAFRPILTGEGKTPRDQTEGDVAVDFLPNDYQTEVTNRTPGDLTVTPATGDDTTSGQFKESAFGMYSTFLDNSKTRKYYNKDLASPSHKYNGQGTEKDKFTTSDEWKNSPGVLYSTNK